MRIKNIAGLLALSTSLLIGLGLSQSTTASENKADESKVADAAKSSDSHPGEKIYKTYCMACHVTEGKPSIAPPIFAVKNHVLSEFPEREDFVKQVADWVKAPNADEALMPGAIRKFGLMPPLPMKDSDLKAVAEYLYDVDMNMPDWYQEHYEAEHGKKPNQ